MRSSESHQRRLFLASSLGVALTSVLSACGGGSDDTASDSREVPAGRSKGDADPSKDGKGRQKRRARSFARKGVTSIAIGRDGAAVGVAYADGRVRLLDGEGARDKRLLKAKGSVAVAGLVFSADGRYLVSVGRDSVAELWNVETGERRLSLQGHEHALRAVAASADGSVVATAGDETRVMVWDGATGKLKRILGGHTDFVNTVSVSPGGSLVAGGDAAARILVWQISTGSLMHALRGHADEVNAVAFNADGALLASAGEDGKVILWDMADGRQLQALQGQGLPMRGLAFNNDGSLLAGGGLDGRLVVWDMSTRTIFRDIAGSSGAVNVVNFDRNDKNRVFVGDDQDGFLSWNLSRS